MEENFIPLQDDPSIPRPFKRVPVLDSDGRIVGYKFPEFDPSVMPDPSTIDFSPIVDCTNHVEYQQLMNSNQSVNIVGDPNIDILDTIDTLKNI